jgi:hypothetical protein
MWRHWQACMFFVTPCSARGGALVEKGKTALGSKGQRDERSSLDRSLAELCSSGVSSFFSLFVRNRVVLVAERQYTSKPSP